MNADKYPENLAGKYPQTYLQLCRDLRRHLRLFLSLNLNLNLDFFLHLNLNLFLYLNLDLNLNLFTFLKSFPSLFA